MMRSILFIKNNKAVRAAQNFVRSYAYVLRGHIPSNKGKLILILALSAVSAFSQGGTIAFIAFAVNYLQKQVLTGIPLLDRILSNRTIAIGALAVSLLILVLVGAKSAYFAMVKARDLARSFHLKCAKIYLSVLRRYTAMEHYGLQKNEGEFTRFLLRDTIHLGNSLEIMVRMLEPLLRSVVAIIMLFWISWQLSIITVPLFFLFIPGIYGVTSSVQRVSNRFFEPTLTGMFENVISIVNLANMQNLQFASEKHTKLEDMFEKNAAVQDYFDQYDRIQLANGKVQLTIAGLSSVLIVWVLIAGGYLAAISVLSWGLVLAYLMAVSQVLASIKMIMSYITNLSIFYPAVFRYHKFLGLIPKEDTHSDKNKITIPDIKKIMIESDEKLPGGKKYVEIKHGKPVFYLNDYPVNRFTLKHVIDPLAACSSLEYSIVAKQTCFIGCNAILPPVSIRENLIGNCLGRERERSVERYLDLLDLRSEVQALDSGLDTIIDKFLWLDISSSLKMALVLIPILFDTRPLILLDMWIMHRAKEKARNVMFELLKDKILLLVANGLSLPITLADSVIVVQNGRISGIGSLQWFEDIKPKLKNNGIGKRQAETVSDTTAQFGV